MQLTRPGLISHPGARTPRKDVGLTTQTLPQPAPAVTSRPAWRRQPGGIRRILACLRAYVAQLSEQEMQDLLTGSYVYGAAFRVRRPADPVCVEQSAYCYLCDWVGEERATRFLVAVALRRRRRELN